LPASTCIPRGRASSTVYNGTNPSFTNCEIHDNKLCGVQARDGGRGTFEDCKIYGHKIGVFVTNKGSPLLRRCQVKNNTDLGVFVDKDAEATVEDCDLRGNRNGAFGVDPGGKLHKARNNE